MSESQPGQTPSVPPSKPAAPINADGDGEMQTRIAATPFALSQEPVTPVGESHEPTSADPSPAPAYEHLGELPATYGTQSIYLVAYDPRQLFAYWDVDWAASPAAAYSLHVCQADGTIESQVDISAADAGRYLPVAIPGGTYSVELGANGRDGRWQPVAVSGRVTMPPEGLAGEADPKFATLPFHLSFQRLIELIQGAMSNGEDLTAALARLQREDQPAVTSLFGTFSGLNTEQLHTLELLLGQKFDVHSGSESSRGPGSSEAHVLRDRHEVLSAPIFSSGEHLSSGGLSSGHGVTAPSMGSETLSSGELGRRGTLPGGIGSSETLSSGALGRWSTLIGGAGGSETLSSLTGGPNSEAWRMAGEGAPGGSEALFSERAEMFLQALGSNLDQLGSLFSAVNAGLSSGFSPGASSDLFSPHGGDEDRI